MRPPSVMNIGSIVQVRGSDPSLRLCRASRKMIRNGPVEVILKLTLAGLVVAFCALAAAQTLSPEVRGFVKFDAPVLALTHVRVIDGTGAAAREDQTVVVSHGKIEFVSDAAGANVPPDAQVLDLHGYSVIPGLVGMHEHMFYPVGPGSFGEMSFSFPRLYLAGGVTTIRTTGSLEPYTDLEIHKAIEAGRIPGPKMHVTGPYLEGAGSWALQLHQLSGPEDATRTVNYWLDEGVDNFKPTCSSPTMNSLRRSLPLTNAAPRLPVTCARSGFAKPQGLESMTSNTD